VARAKRVDAGARNLESLIEIAASDPTVQLHPFFCVFRSVLTRNGLSFSSRILMIFKTGFYPVKAQKVAIQVVFALGIWYAHLPAVAQTPHTIIAAPEPADLEQAESILAEDFITVRQLQAEFSDERANLQNQVDEIAARLTRLESQQFSPTSQLSGQAIFAVNAGVFEGDRVISPRGATVTRDQPNPTLLYRFSVDINTSFNGNDLLKLRLSAASAGSNDNAAGLLEPNLGSALDFAIPGTEQISLSRLYYTFNPTPDLSVTAGARMVAGDFIDKNRYANVSFRDFSTQALINNFLLVPRPGGSGGAIDWRPGQGAFSLRAVYIASSAAEDLPENQQFFGGGGVNNIRLFPISGGGAGGGLLGDPYLAIAELEYAPTRSLAVRLQYSRGEVLGSNFQVLGVNFDWAITPEIGIFARYGYASYPETTVGDIRPNYWSAGVSFQNVLRKGDLAGIGIAQPFIVTEIGNTTQTNIEAFYNFPLNDHIRITPLLQVISNAANQNSNGVIVTGTIRTVFTF